MHRIGRLNLNLLTVVVVTTKTEARDGDYVVKDVRIGEKNYVSTPDSNGGGDFIDGSGGNGNGNGKFSGGDGDDNGGDNEEQEFGPILKFEEVILEAEAQRISLPADMLEAAKTVGLRKVFLLRYLDLQGSTGLLGFLKRSSAWLRNRMLADPSLLFKIGTEIVIDSCCATFAEVKKRGKDFWAEFELYAADLLVGVVVNVALVGMLAPYARIGSPSVSQGYLGHMKRAYGALPSSVFEAERPGSTFTTNQRIAAYFYKGIMYGLVGFGCGIIGQGIANLIMTAKRSIRKSDDDIPVPPLMKSAALWGVFLAVSSNTLLSDYQWARAYSRGISNGKSGSTCCIGFYGRRKIRQQCVWWHAVCRLGEVVWCAMTNRRSNYPFIVCLAEKPSMLAIPLKLLETNIISGK